MIETLVVLGKIVGLLFLLYYVIIVIVGFFYMINNVDALAQTMEEWYHEPSKNEMEERAKEEYKNKAWVRVVVVTIALLSLPIVLLKRSI